MKFIHNLCQHPLKILPVAVCAVCFLCILLSFGGIKIFYTNSSSSAPKGIYVLSPTVYTYDQYMVVACPIDMPDLHVPKGYLLLKKIAALPGDSYTVSDTTLTVRQKEYPIAAKEGLPHLPAGTYTVPPGYILFLNDPDISLDSRYLGPIPMTSCRAAVSLIISYASIDSMYSLFRR